MLFSFFCVLQEKSLAENSTIQKYLDVAELWMQKRASEVKGRKAKSNIQKDAQSKTALSDFAR